MPDIASRENHLAAFAQTRRLGRYDLRRCGVVEMRANQTRSSITDENAAEVR